MKTKRRNDPKTTVMQSAKGICLFVASLLLFLALLTFKDTDPTQNCLGLFGHLTGWILLYLLGLASFLIPVYLGWCSLRAFTKVEHPIGIARTLYFAASLVSISLLLALIASTFPNFATYFKSWIFSDYSPRNANFDPTHLRHYLGGVPCHYLYADCAPMNFKRLFGPIGTTLIFSTILTIAIMLFSNCTFEGFSEKLVAKTKQLVDFLVKRIKPKLSFARFTKEAPTLSNSAIAVEPPRIRKDPLKTETRIHIPEPTPKKTPPSEAAKIKPNQIEKIGDYILPDSSLLTEVKQADLSVLKNDLKKSAEILEETFLSFGIEAKVGAIHPGPTITSFEVHPAVGVKVQKITALESDIALNMQAKSIRIIAPIPGKPAVGIEVPNPHPQEVSFRELLEHYRASNKKAHIPLLLGKLVNGDDMWTDLTKMPHLIIAGATGSGKSVCINTIVMSIVMNSRPDEIKLVMVDPKKVELSAYSKLPHMLAPVITEPSGACAALNWLVKEMEKRYEIFRQLAIRNIHGFNGRKANREHEESLEIEVPEKMPYIVVIIDELADLMMVSSSDVETPIARIAQMARAVGIHLILATQRPSREVITGLIKANFPTRIAFKVSSRINSQIIIDENGAELLLGNGDMLFMPPGTSSLVRTQGGFIRDEDIHRVIAFIREQAPTNFLIPSFDNYHEHLPTDAKDDDERLKDLLFEDAKNLVLDTGNASTTFLQRKLKIGYARAASLMDQLEASAIIGPSEGARPRKIFYPNSDIAHNTMDDEETE